MEMNLIMPMRNKVKELLDGRGLTVYQFVKETGIAPGTGYKLYKDPKHRPSPDVLEAICETYEIQPNHVLEWIRNEPVTPKQAKKGVKEQPETMRPQQQDTKVVEMPLTDSREAV